MILFQHIANILPICPLFITFHFRATSTTANFYITTILKLLIEHGLWATASITSRHLFKAGVHLYTGLKPPASITLWHHNGPEVFVRLASRWNSLMMMIMMTMMTTYTIMSMFILLSSSTKTDSRAKFRSFIRGQHLLETRHLLAHLRPWRIWAI